MRQRSETIKDLDSSALAVIQEVIGSIRVIKAFGQESREHDRFVRRSAKRMSQQVRLSIHQAVFNVLIGLTIALGTAAALYIGVRHVRVEVRTIGSLLMIMAYIAQIYQPLQTLTGKVADFQVWLASLDRTFALLDQNPEIAELQTARPIRVAHRQVRNSGTSASPTTTPEGGSQPLVSHPCWDSRRNCRRDRRGQNRPPEPAHAVLRSDRRRCAARRNRHSRVPNRDLRKQFAVVLQEPVLFPPALRRTLHTVSPTPTMTKLLLRLRLLPRTSSFLICRKDMKRKLEERGSRLSGGERQRISLARLPSQQPHSYPR